MRLRLLLSLVFLLVLALAGFLVSRLTRPTVVKPVPNPTNTAEKLIGTWRRVKTNHHEPLQTVYIVDYARDGKVTGRRTLPNKPSEVTTNSYTVVGDTIHVTPSDPSIPPSWGVFTILLLTEDRLVIVNSPEIGGHQSEFERVWPK